MIGQFLSQLVGESDQPLLSGPGQKCASVFPVNIHSVEIIVKDKLGKLSGQLYWILTACGWELSRSKGTNQ